MTSRLHRRVWVPAVSEDLVQSIAAEVATGNSDLRDRIESLVEQNRAIHERDCINLNPAANVMNPAAEALLASSLGTRPSLGYPGAKYEMGLEAVEQIEVIAAELAAEVFDAAYAEIRVGSGALANLYAFMACCAPGDTIIVPPASIAGHVTHNDAGAAGQYGLDIVEAPIDAGNYTIDTEALRALARQIRPKMITVGSSLNLTHHPVAAIREIADEVGAIVLFDAAHLSGLIAGKAWPNPLEQGAHVMTMSTYKSLGGPPSGLLVTNDPAIAERVDAIAFPGLTANFDASNTAALAITLLDWQATGEAYAQAMVDAATELSTHLVDAGLPVVIAGDGSSRTATRSHAFALRATDPADGHLLAQRLRRANLLTSGIGLPGDFANVMGGVRLGTNEAVRWGIDATHMHTVGEFVARAVSGVDATALADEVAAFRRGFSIVHFCR